MAKTAYLWCPAYPLADAAQRERAEGAAHLLAEACGLNLVVSPLLDRHLGVGAWLPVEERLADLDRGSRYDLLIAARGGYGCLDLLPQLISRRQRMPALMGYSDLTVLQALWRRRAWGPCWYGFMPGITAGGRALTSAIACLAGDAVTVDSASDPAVEVLRTGSSQGPLFAACLRVLAGLVGTPAMPDLRGCLLALEDLDERPYRIDRDLNQLHLAGCLDGLAGLVFGQFPCPDPDGYAGPAAIDVARTWAERLDVPTIFGLPIGHHADPLTVPCGAMTTLRATEGLWRLQAAPLPLP